MVDSIIANVSTQTVQAVKRAQEAAQRQESARSQDSGDTVEISSEAAELAGIENEARAVRSLLQDNPGVSLGLDSNFDTEV